MSFIFRAGHWGGGDPLMWFEGVFVQKMVGNSWFNKFNFEMKNKSKLNLDIWCCYLKSAPTFFSPCCRTILAGDRSIYPLYHFHLVSLDLTRNLLYFWFLISFFFFFKETIQEKRYRVFFFSSRHLWLSNCMPCRAGNCKCRDSFPAEERNRGRERELKKSSVKRKTLLMLGVCILR